MLKRLRIKENSTQSTNKSFEITAHSYFKNSANKVIFKFIAISNLACSIKISGWYNIIIIRYCQIGIINV